MPDEQHSLTDTIWFWELPSKKASFEESRVQDFFFCPVVLILLYVRSLTKKLTFLEVFEFWFNLNEMDTGIIKVHIMMIIAILFEDPFEAMDIFICDIE